MLLLLLLLPAAGPLPSSNNPKCTCGCGCDEVEVPPGGGVTLCAGWLLSLGVQRHVTNKVTCISWCLCPFGLLVTDFLRHIAEHYRYSIPFTAAQKLGLT
jgi:hypothetical protein